MIEIPARLRTKEVVCPGASAEEIKKRRKHVLKIRDGYGEYVERVIFRGFEPDNLNAAIDAYILAHAMGDAEGSFLWEHLYRQELERGDQH